MRKAFFFSFCMVSLTMSAQKQPPLVYDVEDTGAKMATPEMFTANELPMVNTLRNPGRNVVPRLSVNSSIMR